MKRIISLLLAVAMLATMCLALTPDEAAKDIGKYGIMGGFPDGSLRLEQNVTRAQMAKMITIMNGELGYVGSSSKFKDVADSYWGAQYIEYARDNNIVGGFPDGTFRPEDNVTKDQVIKMVVCALKYDKYELSYRPQANAKLVYPSDYILLALRTEIIPAGEYGDGLQPATRGFVAEVISKALDTPLPYDPAAKGYDVNLGNFKPYWEVADGKEGREYKTLRMTLGN